MLTLMLTDAASVRMSAKLHMIWASIYLIIFLADFSFALSTILFVSGVAATYYLLKAWNNSQLEFTTRKIEFRKFVRPNNTEEVALVNKYRIPFFLLFWLPLAITTCIFGKEMSEEVGFCSVFVGLFLGQLVLFDFINIEIRAETISPKMGEK